MKHFIKHCILFLCIVLVVFFLYNTLFMHLSSFGSDTAKFTNIPDNLKIANTGSSHGLAAFRYDLLNMQDNSFNFAMTSQSLTYDYRIIEQYECKIKNAEILFVPISYFSFYSDEQSQADFNSKNERYYRFLKPEHIKDFNCNEYVLMNAFPVLYASPAELGKAFCPFIPDASYHSTSAIALSDYSQDAANAYNRHYTQNLNEEHQLVPNPSEINAVYNIISLCEKDHIQPILITTPFRIEYNNMFNEDFYNSFYSIINKITSTTGCQYLDYSHDPEFEKSDSFFSNADHLSSAGGMRFTQKLLSAYSHQSN